MDKKLQNLLIYWAIMFLIVQEKQSSSSSSNNNKNLEPFCYREFVGNKLVCSNFTSFRQLDFGKVSNEVYSSVEFEPEKNLRLRLDADLNLAGLQLSPSTAKLTFRNIFDFDFFYNPFLAIVKNKKSNNNGSSQNPPLWLDIRIIDSQWLFSNLPIFTDTRTSSMLQRSQTGASNSGPEAEYFLAGLNLSMFLLENCKIVSPIHSQLFRGSIIKEWIYQSLDSIKYEPRPDEYQQLINEYL